MPKTKKTAVSLNSLNNLRVFPSPTSVTLAWILNGLIGQDMVRVCIMDKKQPWKTLRLESVRMTADGYLHIFGQKVNLMGFKRPKRKKKVRSKAKRKVKR